MTEKLDYKNIDDGDIVDIGGTKLEVIAIPGHTQGSIVLFDREGNYALISDAFSMRTALVNMPDEKRVGLTSYRDGIEKLLGAIRDDTKLYWGHGREPVSHKIPQDMAKACTEILEGKTENDNLCNNHFTQRLAASGKKMMEHTCGSVMLVYDANKL